MVDRTLRLRRSAHGVCGLQCSQIGALFLDEGPNPFGQQHHVERLLEAFVEAVVDEVLRGGFIFAGKGDDEGLLVSVVAAQVAGDLHPFGPAHGQIDDDGVGMEAFRLDARFKAAVGQLVLEVVVLGEEILDAVDENLFSADDQDLVQPFLFELPEGHPMFLEEFDEMFTGDAPILATGDTVATQPARIEPFTHRPWRDLTDLRDLAGGKDFFHGSTPITDCFRTSFPLKRATARCGRGQMPGLLGRWAVPVGCWVLILPDSLVAASPAHFRISFFEFRICSGRVSGLRDRGGTSPIGRSQASCLLAHGLNLGGLERAGRVARVRHLGYMFIRQVPSPR